MGWVLEAVFEMLIYNVLFFSKLPAEAWKTEQNTTKKTQNIIGPLHKFYFLFNFTLLI